jgi:hypothetical protein
LIKSREQKKHNAILKNKTEVSEFAFNPYFNNLIEKLEKIAELLKLFYAHIQYDLANMKLSLTTVGDPPR